MLRTAGPDHLASPERSAPTCAGATATPRDPASLTANDDTGPESAAKANDVGDTHERPSPDARERLWSQR